jgi:TonB family protein
MKVSVIVLVGLTIAALLRRQSAAARHWVLAATLACAASAPLLEAVVPSWHLRAMPGWLGRTAAPLTLIVPLGIDRPFDLSGTLPERVSRASTGLPAAQLLARVWAAGVAAGLAMLVVGLLRLAWLRNSSRRLEHGIWVEVAERLSQQYGLRRRVRLFQSRRSQLLATWGLDKPLILIPAGAHEWPVERVRLVLGHELAHVARRDWLVQLVAELFRIAYWFNPLVWILCRRLRHESEHACDDAVLRFGAEGSDYAGHLLAVARSVVGSTLGVYPAPAMARRSTLERRVRAMLNDRLDRTPVTRAAGFAILIALVGFTLPLAGLKGSAQSAPAFSGTLLDAVGRILPNASLNLVNAGTNQTFDARSDEAGRFAFTSLPAGDYRLQTRLPGFAPAQGRMTVSAGQSLVRDVVLQIGSIEETLMVYPGDKGSAAQPMGTASNEQPEFDSCSQSSTGGCIKPPRRIANARPRYPERTAGSAAGGVVKIDGRIGTDGFVKDLRVIAPADADFAAAAVEAISQWQFTATRLDGIPVEAGIRITVRFAA